MRLILIFIVVAIYAIECHSFTLFPSVEERFSVIAVEWIERDSVIAIAKQHEVYSLSVDRWRKRKSQKNLLDMRKQKDRLSSIRRKVKGGSLVIRCRGRRFTEQRTYSIKAYGRDDRYEFVGRHTFVGLNDSLVSYLDLTPRRVVVVDHISKEEWEFVL